MNMKSYITSIIAAIVITLFWWGGLYFLLLPPREPFTLCPRIAFSLAEHESGYNLPVLVRRDHCDFYQIYQTRTSFFTDVILVAIAPLTLLYLLLKPYPSKSAGDAKKIRLMLFALLILLVAGTIYYYLQEISLFQATGPGIGPR